MLKDIEKDVFEITIAEIPFEKNTPREPYFILMPVPNITGDLHIGHGINLVLQDVICRRKLIEGKNVYFPPGADHAGIMGQYNAEKKLRSNNLNRTSLGKDEFIKYMHNESRMHIDNLLNEMRMIGLKANWSHSWFTHDTKRDEAVRWAFVELYKRDLIYREDNLVNWCPMCSSCVADMELTLTESMEQRHFINVESADGINASLMFIQPIMLLGAIGLGVTKSNAKFKKLVGKTFWLPILNKSVRVYEVQDEKRKFYNQNLRLIVPSYNSNDLFFAKKNNIVFNNIFDDCCSVSYDGNKYSGEEANRLIVNKLKSLNIGYKSEKFSQGRMHHALCGSAVYPLVKPQWYLKMHKMEPSAREICENNKTLFSDVSWRDRHIAVLNNIRDSSLPDKEKWWEGACVGVAQGYSSNKDWVISRQNWWGQPVPVWYCVKCGHTMVSTKNIYSCEICNAREVTPDSDVLDVWFSCALWPISVNPFGLRGHFVDIGVMGSDIFYFWVASSNMICNELYGQQAFKKAYTHGLLCDENGKKMSKSLGNVISLSNIINEYGAETLRVFVYKLMFNNSGAEWLKAGQSDIHSAHQFAVNLFDKLNKKRLNKVNSNRGKTNSILSHFQEAVNNRINCMKIGEAYNEICDFINSESFSDCSFSDEQYVELLKTIHPFHPFISNYIYASRLGGQICLSAKEFYSESQVID